LTEGVLSRVANQIVHECRPVPRERRHRETHRTGPVPQLPQLPAEACVGLRSRRNRLARGRSRHAARVLREILDGFEVDVSNIASVPRKGLIVDDEPALRSFAVDVLEEAGYAVLSADSAATALRIARLAPWEFDFLLTDYELGAVNGLELALAVRQLSASIRILVMSGSDGHHLLSAGLIDAFLAKPFSAFALREKVRELLNIPPIPVRSKDGEPGQKD
jgi:CheY-like chemotaxis protein